LATKPIIYNKEIVGVVWVRTHIENELPIIKLKQIVNIAAILSILGFIILMLISSLWRGEIQGIKKELKNIQSNPDFRLRQRFGIFGYITSNINEMLETLAEDNRQQQALELQLIQKEKLASLGKMIAGVAHEVKTPLAIIKTRIQMWQQVVNANEKANDYISPESMQLVIDEINRLSSLVKRLLIFTRPIDKNLKLTSINQLIDEVVCFILLDRNDRRISILKDLSPEVPSILADANSLKQVFINVFSNSVDAMQDGGDISVLTKYDEGTKIILISISDQGTGIPDKIINNIFDPFFTSKDSGSGLGLAISYEIVKVHHGEITLLNNIDKGVTCTITLPVLNLNEKR
jgi:signal transduction histidine kinase